MGTSSSTSSTKTSKSRKSVVRIGLFVREQQDYGYYHVKASIVTIGANAYEVRCIDQGREIPHVPYEKIRNIGDDLYNGLFLNDLVITSQGNTDDQERRLYGFDTRYEGHTITDRRDAERMAKTLAHIERHLDKLRTKYGHPGTFGAYLARVADAIGATSIVQQEGQTHGSRYDDNDHRIQTIGDGAYSIDYKIRLWETRTETERTTA